MLVLFFCVFLLQRHLSSNRINEAASEHKEGEEKGSFKEPSDFGKDRQLKVGQQLVN